MPELPEVQTVVTTLTPRVTHRRIVDVQLLRTDILHPPGTDLIASILGRRITRISRRAKRIIFTLDDQTRFYIHLGMTGQLTAEPATREIRNHTHLILTLEPKDEGRRMKDEKRAVSPVHPSSILHPLIHLRFRDPRRFGGIFWLGANNPGDAALGPEPLEITPAQLAATLQRTTRSIKTALLDQRLIAGLGNIYIDESLFAAGIHPLTPSHRLKPDRVHRLCHQIKRILRDAIKARGSTLRDYVDGNGQLGAAQSLHRVYARESLPCPACATPIKRIVLGGRSTHFCPTCQRRRPGASV